MNTTYGKQEERTMVVRKGSNYSSLQILRVNGNEGILHHSFTLWYHIVILRSNFCKLTVQHPKPKRPPQGRLEIPLSCRSFKQITPRKCLKIMFTPSLPHHAGCQIDHSRNNAIFPSNCYFHGLEYVE